MFIFNKNFTIDDSYIDLQKSTINKDSNILFKRQNYKFIDDSLINKNYKRAMICNNKFFAIMAFQKYEILLKIDKNLSLKILYQLEKQILSFEMKEKLAYAFFDRNLFLESAYLWFELYLKSKKYIFLNYLIVSTLNTNLFSFFFKSLNFQNSINSIFLKNAIKTLFKIYKFNKLEITINLLYSKTLNSVTYKNVVNNLNSLTNNVNEFNLICKNDDFNINYLKALYFIEKNDIFIGLNILLKIFSKNSYFDLFNF